MEHICESCVHHRQVWDSDGRLRSQCSLVGRNVCRLMRGCPYWSLTWQPPEREIGGAKTGSEPIITTGGVL
jgi:hypothetical protein